MEPTLRYVILKHEELPPAHQAEYRRMGIDPATIWRPKWSFRSLVAAQEQLVCEVRDAAWFESYKLVDTVEELLPKELEEAF